MCCLQQVALRTLYNPHHVEPDQRNSTSQTGVGGVVSASRMGGGRTNTTSATNSAPLDRGVVIWWAAPRSYTGEDVVELHLHGGAAVVRAVSEALNACDGVRPAGTNSLFLISLHVLLFACISCHCSSETQLACCNM